MSNSESQDYFRRRERAERAAAKNAATEAARRIHQELAQGYAALLRKPEIPNQPPASR
jgi:plasmid stabilization system protein ParE